MEISFYKSSIGILKIICENNELISLKLVKNAETSSGETDFTNKIKKELDEYFSGKRKIFDIQINPKGSKFQKLVWNELQKIPYGQTKSYSEIAKNIGNEHSQRAIGNACNKNPIIVIIPCHRVINKNGNLCGFKYGNNIKQKLLYLENF